ncbi:hypothetical protein ACIFUY_03475 [Streptomyces sp. CACIS-1.16CA]|uniref:hypothetical protein n=1 Tax=Streptomyces TaxID=1883 RepID=UPI0019517739|nr:hypothetical protein [Streptomyces sp. CS131]
MSATYLREMPTNPTPPSSASSKSGRGCCLVFVALPFIWFISTPFLPEEVFWFPFWLGAVIWNGADGQGGISHLLG